MPISIHPLRGEWDKRIAQILLYSKISIHPLRGEWDCAVSTVTTAANDFNPPTPWGVGPRMRFYTSTSRRYFNPPTPWGVGRQPRGRPDHVWLHFNPPTPWGVGHSSPRKTRWTRRFQSTHSVGSGTAREHPLRPLKGISIHPLRGEWDLFPSSKIQRHTSFQSTHSVGSGTL